MILRQCTEVSHGKPLLLSKGNPSWLQLQFFRLIPAREKELCCIIATKTTFQWTFERHHYGTIFNQRSIKLTKTISLKWINIVCNHFSSAFHSKFSSKPKKYIFFLSRKDRSKERATVQNIYWPRYTSTAASFIYFSELFFPTRKPFKSCLCRPFSSLYICWQDHCQKRECPMLGDLKILCAMNDLINDKLYGQKYHNCGCIETES